MTTITAAVTMGNAERARENSEYVRSLLKVRQPRLAAALDSAVQKFLHDHGTICAPSKRTPR